MILLYYSDPFNYSCLQIPCWVEGSEFKMIMPIVGIISTLGEKTEMPLEYKRPSFSFTKQPFPRPPGYTWWNTKQNFCYVDQNGVAREIISTGHFPGTK